MATPACWDWRIGHFAEVRVSQPIAVAVPNEGVLFAESVHAADFRMAERRDSFHKLFYVLSGCIRYHTPGRPDQTFRAGTILPVARDQLHQISDVAPSTLLLLCLTDPYLASDPDLPELWKRLTARPIQPLELNRPARERIERMWRRAMLEKSHAKIGGGVTVRTTAAQLLVLLARQQTASSADSTRMRVAAVARELDETFFDEWNVDRAAVRAGVSRRRFTALFREATGQSFSGALHTLRLEHAARLLRQGEHSVLGVMFSCGYTDVSHFYRLFRRRFGHPPKQWLVQEKLGRRSRGVL